MAQATFSIRMDEALKKRFDELCSEFGMNATTAFTIIIAMSKTPHLQYLCGFARHGKPLYHYGFIETISSGWYN